MKTLNSLFIKNVSLAIKESKVVKTSAHKRDHVRMLDDAGDTARKEKKKWSNKCSASLGTVSVANLRQVCLSN